MTRWSGATPRSRRRSRIWSAPIRPSVQVGAAPAGHLAKVAHARPMMSLDNAFADEEVARIRRARAPVPEAGRRRAGRADRRAQDRRPVLLAALRGRRLVQALTRGDGTVGEDVTANVRTIARHPRARCPATRPRCSRCAAKSIWRRPISPRSTRGCSPRRTIRPRRASSPIRATPPPDRCARRMRASPRRARCAFFAHGWGEASAVPGETQAEVVAAIRDWGFPVADGFARVADARRGAGGLSPRSRPSAPTCRSTSTASSTRSTGSTGRRGWAASAEAPRWAIAHKFPAERAQTTLERDRHPGRAHRQADPGRAAGAGHRRRRRRHQRDAAQCRRDRAARACGPATASSLQRAGDVIPQIVENLSRDDARAAWPFPDPLPANAAARRGTRGGRGRLCAAPAG